MKITELSWHEAQPLVEKANPTLYSIAENIDFTAKYPIYLLEYDYGEIMADKKKGFLYPRETFDGIFSTIPFSIVAEKTFEMFIEFSGKVFSYRIYKPGDLFHTVQFLESDIRYEPGDILQICSGARNTFLLPKVSESAPHNEMCKHFNMQFRKPHSLDDHYFIFKDLCQATNQPWQAKIIAFSEEWVGAIKKVKPAEFYNYINNYNNRYDSYFRCLPLYNFLISYITSEYSEIPNNAFMNDVIKQFFAIGCGQTPGYVPAIDDELIPYNLIANAYKDIYQIKTIPFAMVPSYIDETKPIYYSIAKEGLAFKPKKIPNTLKVSLEIKNTFDWYKKIINELDMYGGTQFRHCANSLNISVFHDRGGKNDTVLNPHADLFAYDERFSQIAEMLSMSPKDYQTNSSFFTGCFGLEY